MAMPADSLQINKNCSIFCSEIEHNNDLETNNITLLLCPVRPLGHYRMCRAILSEKDRLHSDLQNRADI
jgi:hypothetical protein